MIAKSMMMMIKIDSFLTESKQGFIRRISRVASSTHYLLTLKLTYHMKKISSHKKLSSYKKKLSSQTQTVELFLTILNFLCIHFFSVCYLYVDFFQVSLDLILCSQIGLVTFSLKYFPIMQCYECFLSC